MVSWDEIMEKIEKISSTPREGKQEDLKLDRFEITPDFIYSSFVKKNKSLVVSVYFKPMQLTDKSRTYKETYLKYLDTFEDKIKKL